MPFVGFGRINELPELTLFNIEEYFEKLNEISDRRTNRVIDEVNNKIDRWNQENKIAKGIFLFINDILKKSNSDIIIPGESMFEPFKKLERRNTKKTQVKGLNWDSQVKTMINSGSRQMSLFK